MASIAWNERTESLLIALTHKVRFLSLSQIARTWWTDAAASEAAARMYLQRLCHAGYLERREILAHPEISLGRPVFTWLPGKDGPASIEIAYRCQQRWTQIPRVLSVWIATKKAADLFGGFGGRILRPDHTTHDLHVGTIYCHFARQKPERAQAWKPEEKLPIEANERVPDAVLFDTHSKAFLAVEFGGACKETRVEKLHAFGVRYRLPYELW